jgi:hypothetical protein
MNSVIGDDVMTRVLSTWVSASRVEYLLLFRRRSLSTSLYRRAVGTDNETLFWFRPMHYFLPGNVVGSNSVETVDGFRLLLSVQLPVPGRRVVRVFTAMVKEANVNVDLSETGDEKDESDARCVSVDVDGWMTPCIGLAIDGDIDTTPRLINDGKEVLCCGATFDLA